MAVLALLQCELEHRHQAPHLAMALFATDLQRAGHEVRCALVHPSRTDHAVEYVGGCDLVLLDSIWPFGLQRRLQAAGVPLLVGGHNALQHALRGPAEFVLEGAARGSLKAAVRAALGGGEAPGLWRRAPHRSCGGPPPPPGPAELEPFDPWLAWDYLGPPRAPGSDLRVPSIVGEFGCVWNRSALGAGPYAQVAPRLPELDLHPSARARVEAATGAEGGCTFCAFRFLGPTAPPRAERLDSLVAQARFWRQAGAHGLSVQSEHPLPWARTLLDRLAREGLTDGLDELHLRTIPWLLLRHRDALIETIEAARSHGVRLVLAQVGFEAFDPRTLAIFHKGLSADENRAAARLLGELHAEHEDAFTGTRGHGLVPLHPWSTPEDLALTLEAVRADAPWLAHALTPAARIEFYLETTPLFWKARDEGLVEPAPERFGWDWRFADPAMAGLVGAWTGGMARGLRGADALAEALGALT